MTLANALLGVGIDAVAVVVLGFGTWVGVRSREKPSAPAFAGLLGTMTVWSVCTLGAELAGVLSVETATSILAFGEILAAMALTGAWVIYALGYTGRGTGLTRRRLLMLAGIFLLLLVAGGVLAGGAFTDSLNEDIALAVIAGVLVLEFLYLFGLFCYATFLVVGLTRNHERVSVVQAGMLILGVAAPYLGALLGSQTAVADGSTLGLLFGGALLVGAAYQYPVLTGFPKTDYVARERVVEDLREAVFVINWDDDIIDANEASERLFDRAPDDMFGTPITDVVDGLDGSTLSAGTTGEVTLGTTRGRRQFQYSVSAVGEGRSSSDPITRTVLFRDITNQQTREQRLTVLNRVLRHNLRNEMDVVLAHADRIDDDEVRTAISDRVEAVVDIGTKARDAEEIMQTRTESPSPVDLTDVAVDVVERVRTDERAGEFEVRCPEELTVLTHRAVLERVLAELVDNAVEHADDESPRVEVVVRDRDGMTAELTVVDDGPGIPEREQELLQSGDESQLEHGRGIGLWLVNWGVTQLGGELSFAESDRGGSAVTVRLYGASPDTRPR